MDDHPALTRNDLVDIITPSRRGAAVYKDILIEAAQAPEKWVQHHFIVIFDSASDHERLKLEHWVAHAREALPLPRITALTAGEEERHNPNALRQKAFKEGSNPFVYFQDDDDSLPLNFDKFLDAAYNSPNLSACYGATETVNSKHHLIEQFPQLHNNMYEIDAKEATRWFPTYAHPIAALFRRSALDKTPIYQQDDPAFSTGGAILCLRLYETGHQVSFLPWVIRQVKLHDDNDGGILNESTRQGMIQDIQNWAKDIQDAEIKSFHNEIAEALEKGWITTFREIAAMVETQLGY